MELIYLSLMTQRLKNTKNQLGRRRRSTTEFHSLNEGSVTGSLLSFEMTIVSQLEAMQLHCKESRSHMHQAPPNRSNSTWTPSTDLCMKCNVDATVFKDTINFSVLACMKDSGGRFIAARPQVYQGDPTPQEAKVVASLTALNLETLDEHQQNWKEMTNTMVKINKKEEEIFNTVHVMDQPYDEVSRSFVVRCKDELELTWHLLHSSGNMHSNTYNQNLLLVVGVSPSLLKRHKQHTMHTTYITMVCGFSRQNNTLDALERITITLDIETSTLRIINNHIGHN
ncbi:hypothetical protein JHK84_040596 [Glycine max]|nr:hypothetical protein JHK84_040596 [Glycine max]